MIFLVNYSFLFSFFSSKIVIRTVSSSDGRYMEHFLLGALLFIHFLELNIYFYRCY